VGFVIFASAPVRFYRPRRVLELEAGFHETFAVLIFVRRGRLPRVTIFRFSFYLLFLERFDWRGQSRARLARTFGAAGQVRWVSW